MRLVRVSLAAKYRILFGVAVLLIIGAALAAPWMLVAALVYEQPYREARRVADAHFARLHSLPGGAAPAADLSLLPPSLRMPREPLLVPLPAGFTEAAERDASLPGHVVRALRKLERHTAQPHWERSTEEGQRQFHYVQPVRVTRGCLACHEAGRGPRPYQEGQLAGVIAVSVPDGLSDELVAYYRLWLVGAGALACILAVLVFYVITRYFILSPIQELRGVAVRVAEEGNLEARATVNTGDEFEQLSDSLNTMLDRLRASQEELRRANRLLDEKLEHMAESNVALHEANRVKSEFLANVTHELRTPLAGIIGFAELLREGPEADRNEKTSRYAENILISGRILLEIVNDLLDLAKIEANRLDIHLETVDVEPLCHSLIDFMRPMAERKEIALECHASRDLPVLVTDRARLRQVLFNLLSNAIKFTLQGGRVRLAVERFDAQHVQLSVRDTGPGIAREHQGLIFEKFRQVDQSATREHHGTGLGLAIAKELTELLGGTIGVESEPGRGSTFWVRLPTVTTEPRSRPAVSLL